MSELGKLTKKQKTVVGKLWDYYRENNMLPSTVALSKILGCNRQNGHYIYEQLTNKFWTIRSECKRVHAFSDAAIEKIKTAISKK